MTDTKPLPCCGDSSCVIQPATSGMTTNGGCRCKPWQLQREIIRTRIKCHALQQELDRYCGTNCPSQHGGKCNCNPDGDL